MIAWLIRYWSNSVGLNLQLNAGLERYRAHFPYWFTTGLSYTVVILPLAAILALAQAMGYRGTPEMSLTRSWLTFALVPLGIMFVLALLTMGSWLSGYRPFRMTFAAPAPEMHQLAQRLKSSAEAMDFKTAWSDARGSFVACRDMQLELSRKILSGPRFPMRLSLFIHSNGAVARAKLKLQGRTIVFRNTGESSTCEQVAREILRAAQFDSP